MSEAELQRDRIVAGLMSGTSMDGLDVAICRIQPGIPQSAQLLHAQTMPMPATLRAACQPGALNDIRHVSRVHRQLGEWFSEALAEAIQGLGFPLDLIGSHGQTVAHEHGRATLQLGDPTPLAARFNCPVISDFRQADIAVGGCGAPLVPIIDKLLLARKGEAVLALNIGGISNMTLVPPLEEPGAEIRAFDCGPGNMIMDELVRRKTEGRFSYDNDARLALSGKVIAELLEDWLSRPELRLKPPRSFGSEQYGAAFVDALLAERPPASEQDWADLMATSAEFTCRAITDSYHLFLGEHSRAASLVVSGGGARNPYLVRRLQQLCNELRVQSSSQLGLDADFKEAIAFALLAVLNVERVPGNVPEVTGAHRAVVLGMRTEL